MSKGKKPGDKIKRCDKAPIRVNETRNGDKHSTEYWTAPASGIIYTTGPRRVRSKSANSNCKTASKLASARVLSPESETRDLNGKVQAIKKKGSLCCVLDEENRDNIQYQLPSSPFLHTHGRRYEEKEFTEQSRKAKKVSSLDTDAASSRDPTYVLRKEIHDWKVHEALTNRVENLLSEIETTSPPEDRTKAPRTSARTRMKASDKLPPDLREKSTANVIGNDFSDTRVSKNPVATTNPCRTSNHTVTMSKLHNFHTDEEGRRGIQKQKYPLDDYLINGNLQSCTQASLLSPISPVASPETADVLQNVERLVKNAQQQIMEVSFDSALHTLDENPTSYIGHECLDESLLHICEIVESKFQECNNPSRICGEKDLMTNVPTSSKELKYDKLPVKETDGTVNKPLEISEQNYEFYANQLANGVFLHNKKPFFQKAPNWFKIEPPKQVTVFPVSTTCSLKSKSKSSCVIQQHCETTNTGVVEINNRDHQTSNMQVQEGPRVDIRGGLTIQAIENIHISPKSSSVPIYNNTASYCYQYEASSKSSFVDSNRTRVDGHSTTNSNARTMYDTGKDVQKSVNPENDDNVGSNVPQDQTKSSHANKDTTDTGKTFITNTTNVNNNDNNENENRRQLDLSSTKNRVSIDSALVENVKLKISPTNNEKVTAPKTTNELVYGLKENGNLKKSVSINLTPVTTPFYQEVPITDSEFKTDNEQKETEPPYVSQDHVEILSNLELTHIRSDKNYTQRTQICTDECETGSCSRKCESDVVHREKQRLKEALETIANIQKIRFDVKDTGIVPAECTQICKDKNRCIADEGVLEPKSIMEPEKFKVALEKLCTFNQNASSKISTDSKICQEAIDDFVKMFYGSDGQSKFAQDNHKPSGSSSQNKHGPSKQNERNTNNKITKNIRTEANNEETVTAPKQMKLIPEQKQIKNRQVANKNNKPKTTTTNGDPPTSNIKTSRPKTFTKDAKSPAPHSQLPKDNTSEQEKIPLNLTSKQQQVSLENLNLPEPCVSDVDAILNMYRESMAAICQGTEKLSQLISHHIMKNARSSSDQISSPPVVGEIYEESSIKSTSNLVSSSSKKTSPPFHSAQETFSTDQFPIRIMPCSNKIRTTKIHQQIKGKDNIPEHEDSPNLSLRDDTESSSENNSVCTDQKSARNERETACNRNLIKQRNLSDVIEESSSVHFDVVDNASNSQIITTAQPEISMNNSPQFAPAQHRVAKNKRKPGATQFMDVQYCITEPLEAPMSIGMTLDKKSSLSQSTLRSPFSAYLNLESACDKDAKLHRHSNYDIHSDRTSDINLYKCPVLISGYSDNFKVSDNHPADKLMVEGGVAHTKQVELQVFNKILDAMKNSSHFMNRFVISILNGMEIHSINDMVRNLEDAAVHPNIIEQLLIILRERSRDNSSTGDIPDFVQTNDTINDLKNSIGCKGAMAASNIDTDSRNDDPAALHHSPNQVNKSWDPAERETNLKLNVNEYYAYSHDSANSHVDKALEVELQNQPVSNENTKNDRVKIPGSILENKSCVSEPSLGITCNSSSQKRFSEIGAELQDDYQRVEVKSLGKETCCTNEITPKNKSDPHDIIENSTSVNTVSKKHDSDNCTDKDISFLIPYDNESNSNLSDVGDFTSITLNNESTGKTMGMQIKRNCQNGLCTNSPSQGMRTKMNSNAGATQSSTVTNKTKTTLKRSDDLITASTNSSGNRQMNDRNIMCKCKTCDSHEVSKTETRHVVSQSLVNPVNKLAVSQIQANYNHDQIMDLQPKTARNNPNLMTVTNAGTSNKRSKPSKLAVTSKSHMKKAVDSSRTNSKKSNSFKKKVKGDKKVSRDIKKGSRKCVEKTQSSDSEKSNSKNDCALCIQLVGTCNCLDCTNCVINCTRCKEIMMKRNIEKEKLSKSALSPRHENCFKFLEQNADKLTFSTISNSALKELSPMPLESSKKAHVKNRDYCQGIRKMNENLTDQKDAVPKMRQSKLKPHSSMLSCFNNNNGSINCKTTAIKKILQDAASTAGNSKVEDKVQNTENIIPHVTICKSTEMYDMGKYRSLIPCKATESLCTGETIAQELRGLLPRKLDKHTEIDRVNGPIDKTTSTIESSKHDLATRNSTENYRITNCERTGNINCTVMTSTEIKDFSTKELQTLTTHNDSHKHEAIHLRTDPEVGVVSVPKAVCEKLFDDATIIVLQPLNELDHTFFIAKPNCLEQNIIKEKLNKNFNTKNTGITDRNHLSVCNLSQQEKQSQEDLIQSNYNIAQHVNCVDKSIGKDIELNNARSRSNRVKHQDCQINYPGDRVQNSTSNRQSSVAFAPTYERSSMTRFCEKLHECEDLCTNDSDCLEICPQSSPKSYDSRFHCQQDCPNEEICHKICSQDPHCEQSLQTNSVNINAILEKFITENNMPNVRLPIVKPLLQELKKVKDCLRVEIEKLEIIYEDSESHTDFGQAKKENGGKLVEGARPRYSTNDPHQDSVQYEEPDEKLQCIIKNRKSLSVPNVVRDVADMHPSTKLERLKIRPADPLVSGNFSKSESDRRYSVFNKQNTASSIDLNDPKTREYLASLKHSHGREESSSDHSMDTLQSTVMNTAQKTPTPGRSNDKHVSKLHNSRRGMDADAVCSKILNERPGEHDDNLTKSFESCDLEPGEFLHVRSPLDEPMLFCLDYRVVDTENPKLLRNLTKFSNRDDKSGLATNAHNTFTPTTQPQPKSLENESESGFNSAKMLYAVMQDKDDENQSIGKSDSVYAVRSKPFKYVANGIVEKIIDKDENVMMQSKSNPESSISMSTDDGFTDKNLPNFPDKESDTVKTCNLYSATENCESLVTNRCVNLMNEKNSCAIISKNKKKGHAGKCSDFQHSDGAECSNRPEIIDHFLGKTKLEDMKIRIKIHLTHIPKVKSIGRARARILWVKSESLHRVVQPKAELSKIQKV
ncbi:uncharacterized protein LOC124307530 [Neodiprion virginianus]|uniref:uncharacterized protein LOC124307530 n=1 Tax=Neodiprion virginianus TaxID=2961670 RepID=UPI001EE6FFFD|nr:uncharacterized protein LOC124307530 [Neodiprion virginianus]